MIDIKGIDKAALLAALYNASKPQGMGMLKFVDETMTREDAADILQEMESRPLYGRAGYDFDYLKGRVMKVNIAGDELDPEFYDRDLGKGAAEKVVDSLR